MSLIIFIVVVIIVLALAWILIDLIPKIEQLFKNILKILAVLVAILLICNRAGLF